MTLTPPPEFQVQLAVDVVSRVVRVAGEIDLTTAPRLRERISEVADRADGDIVVDLADVRYIDSSGMLVLLRAQERVVGLGFQVVLRNPSRQVTALLAICNIAAAFPVEPGRDTIVD